MPTAPLFPEPPTARTKPLGHTEPAVRWPQESTRPEAAEARQALNAWYRDFPDPRGNLARRLRSETDAEHYGALDELYVYHLLRQTSPNVRYEEGGRGPDFRVYAGGRQLAAVEVLSLFMRDDWTRETRAFGVLGDYLNRQLRPERYFLDVEVTVQRADLPLRAITDAARRFLASLPDPRAVAGVDGAGGDLPATDFVRPGVHVRLRALPMRPGAASATDPDARIVGMGPAIGGMVNSYVRLKRALSDKRAERYDLPPDVPYLIVVGNHDTFCSENQLMLAVYGHNWERLGYPGPPLFPDEALRGFFDSGWKADAPAAPHNTRVSAVTVINEPRAFRLESIQHLVMENPHARTPLPEGLFPATHRFRAWEAGRWEWRPRHPEAAADPAPDPPSPG